jgi:hypothetical protein
MTRSPPGGDIDIGQTCLFNSLMKAPIGALAGSATLLQLPVADRNASGAPSDLATGGSQYRQPSLIT